MSSDPKYMKRYRETHPEYVKYEILRRRAQNLAVRRLRKIYLDEYNEYYREELDKLVGSKNE